MPTTPLLPSFSVAVEGFSAFERDALTSFFRLAARRSPAYHQVDEAGVSDFLIADADHAGALAAVRRGQRQGDTVFVGARAPKGAAAWLPRPIDPMHIVRELDLLVEARLAPPEPPSALLPLDLDIGAEAPGARPDMLLPESRVAPVAKRPERRARARNGKPRGGSGRTVLVVDDSEVARQFLARRLRHFGYRVETAASGEQALDVLASRSFALVFLDIVLGPPGSVDGLRVCQTIKQQGGAKPAAVLLVTGLDGSADRVRGSLAGADAYLVKPLMEPEFLAALRQVDPAFVWNDEAAAPA